MWYWGRTDESQISNASNQRPELHNLRREASTLGTADESDVLLSAGFPKNQALWGGPLSSPDGEVGVHHVDQLIEGALVGKRLPPVALVE